MKRCSKAAILGEKEEGEGGGVTWLCPSKTNVTKTSVRQSGLPTDYVFHLFYVIPVPASTRSHYRSDSLPVIGIVPLAILLKIHLHH